MKVKMNKLKRQFHSPFGIAGAVFAGLVFLIGIISILGFQDDKYALIAFTVLLFFFSIYYQFIKKGQTLNPEEEKIMFVAHVINRFFIF